MGKATITITDTGTEGINLKIEFEPEINAKDNTATLAQRLGLQMLNYAKELLE